MLRVTKFRVFLFLVLFIFSHLNASPKHTSVLSNSKSISKKTDPVPPSVAASNLIFFATQPGVTGLRWIPGNGTTTAVFVSAGSSGSPTIQNNTTYTYSSFLGAGSTAGSGWYCVYNN